MSPPSFHNHITNRFGCIKMVKPSNLASNRFILLTTISLGDGENLTHTELMYLVPTEPLVQAYSEAVL